MGTRFHFLRRSARRALPFVDWLLGSYWTGSGAEDREYQSQRLAVQAGGGIDLRRAGSVHGLRLSVDYRRVFASPANRNQLRFVTSYVLGPRNHELRNRSKRGFCPGRELGGLSGLFQRVTLTIGWGWLTLLAVYMMNTPSQVPKRPVIVK